MVERRVLQASPKTFGLNPRLALKTILVRSQNVSQKFKGQTSIELGVFLVVATPRLTTANSSGCANRGQFTFCDDKFCMLYFHMCTFTHVQFSTTMLLGIDSIKSR